MPIMIDPSCWNMAKHGYIWENDGTCMKMSKIQMQVEMQQPWSFLNHRSRTRASCLQNNAAFKCKQQDEHRPSQHAVSAS